MLQIFMAIYTGSKYFLTIGRADNTYLRSFDVYLTIFNGNCVQGFYRILSNTNDAHYNHSNERSQVRFPV